MHSEPISGRALAVALARTLAGALVGLALVWLVGRPLGMSFEGAVYTVGGMVLGALVWFVGQPVFRRLGRVMIAERDARNGAVRVGRDGPGAPEDGGPQPR